MTNAKSEELAVLRAYPFNRQSGKIGWAILWLLGIPLPVLLVLYLVLHH